MSASPEADPTGVRGDPLYVPTRLAAVVMERMEASSPGQYYHDLMEAPSLSEDSINGINENCKRKKQPIRKSMNKSSNRMITTDSDREDKMVAETKEMVKCFVTMSAPGIGACAFEALSKAEEVNIKSKNLKGGLKGQLRDSVKDLKEMITALMLKINAKGVIELFRAENAKETAKNLERYRNRKTKKGGCSIKR